jgi:hypothetical protein
MALGLGNIALDLKHAFSAVEISEGLAIEPRIDLAIEKGDKAAIRTASFDGCRHQPAICAGAAAWSFGYQFAGLHSRQPR